MSAERCLRCDRVECFAVRKDGTGIRFLTAKEIVAECDRHKVDWRQRAIIAEALVGAPVSPPARSAVVSSGSNKSEETTDEQRAQFLAGAKPCNYGGPYDDKAETDWQARVDEYRTAFAAVRIDERDQCAKVAEKHAEDYVKAHPHGFSNHATYDATVIAYKIRARSTDV